MNFEKDTKKIGYVPFKVSVPFLVTSIFLSDQAANTFQVRVRGRRAKEANRNTHSIVADLYPQRF